MYYAVDADLGEEYAWVESALPDGLYAEIEDDTYGRLTGLRLYLPID